MSDIRIGDEVYVHGFVDEVRKDVVIIKNEGGYFGTVADEIIPSVQPRKGKWMNRRLLYMDVHMATCDQCGKRVVVGVFCPNCGSYNGGTSDDR